jgi:glutamine synthetase
MMMSRSIPDILKEAQEKNVSQVRLQFVDINGAPKHMSVHVAQLEKALNNEILLDGSSIQGFRTIETSDMAFFPDLDTFQVLPEEPGDARVVARVMCNIHNPDGTPFEGCPRGNLQRVIREARDMGYVFNVGPELEFFLFKKDAEGRPTLETHDTAGYYDLAPDDLGEHVRSEIVDYLLKLGFYMEADHHEVAEGQHEIDFRYSDALTQADNVTNVKIATRRIASRYGLHATFMPKPIAGINGSGMHCNMSLGDLEGNNTFYDPNGEHQLSQTAHQFVAGILKHVQGFTAVTNPLVNSYKRLVPGYEAPVYVAWSTANRSALVRVPAKRGPGTRIELRSPDPAANPYLAFAVMLQAGLDGIRNNIVPPSTTQLNIYKLDETEREQYGIPSLPGSLNEAMYEFKKSDISRQALGQHIYDEFLKAKQAEWDSFRMFVTSWETERYMSRH